VFEAPSRELRKAGAVAGITDRVYPITGDTVAFDDVLVRGDLLGPLDYNGRRLEISAVNTIIGLERSALSGTAGRGPRGPALRIQARA